MEQLWEMGLDGEKAPEMTPSEVKGMIRKHQARMDTRDRMAWRAGRYNTFAFNAPKKYPPKPFSEKYRTQERRTEPMRPEEMKNVFLRMMGGENHANGG